MKRLLHGILLGLLSFITIVISLFALSSQPIQKWDEGTNIDVVIETYESRSFPLLLYNEQPFFEKPPLWYYIQLLIVSFGFTTLQSFRITSALSGIGIILITVLLAKKLWGNTAGYITWITLLLSLQLFITNIGGYFATHTLRSADLDAFVMLLIVLSLYIALLFHSSKKASVLAGLCIGVSVLTKGPVGFLMLLPLSVWFYHPKKLHALIYLWVSAGIVVFPWILYMFLNFGFHFWHAFYSYHISHRFFTAIEGHNQPVSFYFSLLSNPTVYPPGIVLAYSIIILLAKKMIVTQKELLIIFLCFLLYITIPMFMQTKLAWYILPVYPFAALLIGYVVSFQIKKRFTL